ncbi:type II toxin-antitoxin system VapB family antitoxin [Inquilinus limosus]|uniref:Transcription factor n=1 Tax=Inquilinus limosus MP06 TaxID=1398085 RepID=A0A0A0DFK4_9PROT|nr:type II toxin-antitoxin system VapB family antitoxin [Inquilinus limosus]KGM35767.1 transcription factor [Inquilinus limosus MP06]
MPFHIRDAETDALVRELARRRQIGLTEAVKLAVRNELRRDDEAARLRERLRPLQDSVAARPLTGLEADKAFFDELSGEA